MRTLVLVLLALFACGTVAILMLADAAADHDDDAGGDW